MDSLYIVMPAYNEEENIEETVRNWYPLLEGKSDDSKLVIADSGSTDRTHEILTQLQTEYPKLEILDDTDRFHGPKVIALYKYAIENEADFIFQTDSDGQTAPEEFQDFWNERNKYNGIFGSRKSRGDGLMRSMVEKTVCILLRMYFGVKVPDANAPFRLMSAAVLEKYVEKLPDDFNIPNIMLTAYFAYYHEKICFREISFKARQKGSNSVNLPRIFRIGMRAVRDFRIFKKEMTN